jgi:hypothetical protein
MHPRTEEMLRHLDANRVVLRAAVDGVPPELRETRPSPDRWSVAEVLEHLTRVEEGISRLLAMRLGEAQTAGQLSVEADTSAITSSINHELMLDRRRLITAGERVVPRGGLDATTAMSALEASRTKLRELIVAYDGLTLGAVSHPHPVFGTINGYQWFIFIGSHEARHAAQIREIATQLTE